MNAVIALNPGQMAEAQTTTNAWAERKLEKARATVAEQDSVVNTLRTYGLRTEAAERVLDKAAEQVRFYEKVRAALAAGYYIIPPFALQLFAVRTNLAAPTREQGDRSWMRHDEPPRRLAIGAGQWRNPVPVREQVGTRTEPQGDGSRSREVAIYRNTEWRDLELPGLAHKPEIIDAVGKALGERIFDALGIAPAYLSADPIVAGRILRPGNRGALTFLVAWWLDEADL